MIIDYALSSYSSDTRAGASREKLRANSGRRSNLIPPHFRGVRLSSEFPNQRTIPEVRFQSDLLLRIREDALPADDSPRGFDQSFGRLRRRFAPCLLHQWNRLPEAASFQHPWNVRGLLIRPPPDRSRRPPAPGRFHPDGPSTRRSRAPPGAGSTATRRQATTRLHRPRLSWSTPDRAWTN